MQPRAINRLRKELESIRRSGETDFSVRVPDEEQTNYLLVDFEGSEGSLYASLSFT